MLGPDNPSRSRPRRQVRSEVAELNGHHDRFAYVQAACFSRNGSAQRGRSFIANELGELVAGLAGVSAIGAVWARWRHTWQAAHACAGSPSQVGRLGIAILGRPAGSHWAVREPARRPSIDP